MTPPVHTAWSVGPWSYHDAESPTIPRRLVRELTEGMGDLPDDSPVTVTAGMLRDLLAAVTAPEGGKPGARIHDHDRGVTYRATVDPVTSDLDRLEVTVTGWIDENVLRRVPVARIRREVLAQVARDAQARAEAGHDNVFTFVPTGGLSERPSLEEVARLMRDEHRDRAWFHAEYPDVPPRTVDGWMRRARKQYPTTPGGDRQPGRPKKEQKR